MKHAKRFESFLFVNSVLCSIAVALLLALPQSSCFGPKAKVSAQFPALQLAWPGVNDDYLMGIADGVTLERITETLAERLRVEGGRLEAAIDCRDLEALRLIPWAITMEPWASHGIAVKQQMNEIGPIGAGELALRLEQFTKTIKSLQGIN